MADILISKFTTQIPRVGATPATPGFAESEGQDPVAPSGTPQVYTPVTIGSPANGLSIDGSQVLTIGLASTSATGALSSTDWNTFNGKLNLTSPITGYTVGANTALADTDTILQAFGKVQGQINARISGTIASGQVAFGTGVNTVGGSNNLFWDNVNGRLGVGTNAPTHPLHVITTVADIGILLESTTNPAFILRRASVNRLILTAGGNIGTVNGLGNGLNIQTDGTTRISILSGGNVGIGNITPTNTLDVNGTARIRTISNLGSAATSVLVPSATGVVSLRTVSELAGDIGLRATTNETLESFAQSGTVTINDLVITRSNIEFTGTATVTLNGIVPLYIQQEIAITNRTTGVLTINGQNAGSSAINRFAASFTLRPNQTVYFKSRIDTSVSAQRWCQIGSIFLPVNGLGVRSEEWIGLGTNPVAGLGLIIRNPNAGATAFRIRNAADTATIFDIVENGLVINANYYMGIGVGITAGIGLRIRANAPANIISSWETSAGTEIGVFNGSGDIISERGLILGAADSRNTLTASQRLIVRGTGTTTGQTLLLEDSAGTDNAEFIDNGQIRFLRLPTSSAGLAAGSLWNDNGTVRIGTTVTFRDEETVKTTASADQTLPSGVLTILDYDTTLTNNSTATYTVGTTGRITINTTGIYTITAGVVIEADAVTALESAFLGIFRNGDLVAISSINTTIAAGAQSGLSTSTILSLTATDIIDCRALVNSVGGVANGLARRLGTLLGANATQVNSLSITKNSM